MFDLISKGKVSFKTQWHSAVDGTLVAPKATSYHTSIQVFQALYFCQLLHGDEGALCWLLLSQLDVQGVLLRKGLATSVKMISLEGQDATGEIKQGVRAKLAGGS